MTIDSIQELGPNLLIEKGASQITTSDEPVVDAYTMIHVRQDGNWLTSSAAVLQQPALPEFDWKSELSFFEGEWRTQADDWSVETTIEWVAGGNFLKRSFSVKNGDIIESTGVQIIGWDPLEGAVTSWVFGSNGGHGRGWWHREEDNWVIRSEGTTASGELIQATNIITLLGENEFRWQSTSRSISGAELEDTQSILVRRVTNNKSN